MCPEFPATLTKTEQDWEYGLCVHPNVASDDTFQPEFIEQFRIKPRMRTVQHGLEPWPEAQARAKEIVAAWDQYREADKAAQERSGFAHANRAEREAVETLHELEERIAGTRATTLKGMLVKARIAAVDLAAIATVEDLEQALEERLDMGHIIGLSLILDVLDLHGGDA
jgi:hypothetical protein